jgi:hypothetical protein
VLAIVVGLSLAAAALSGPLGRQWIAGLAVTALSLVLVGVVLFRFERLQRSPALRARWGGRGLPHFPATRASALTGSLIGLLFGLILLDQSLHLLPERLWAGLFVGALLIAVVAGVRDYRLHRRVNALLRPANAQRVFFVRLIDGTSANVRGCRVVRSGDVAATVVNPATSGLARGAPFRFERHEVAEVSVAEPGGRE